MKKDFKFNVKLSELEKSSLLDSINKIPKSKTFLVGKTLKGNEIILAEIFNNEKL